MEECFRGSTGSVVCLYLQNFHTGSFPRKEISALLSLLWVGGCASPWKRTVFKAKWNGFELAEFGSVKTMTCKDIGSGCNVPQELERETFWEFWPYSYLKI